MKKSNLLFSILLALACMIVYVNSLPNEFVIDDKLIIPENPTISNLRILPILFVTSYAVSYPTTYYRPLFTATLQLEYQLWKLRPWGYRLINILFHILVTLMVFRLGLLFFPNPLSAFFTGLIYAIHPVHVESVAWISGRCDVLACLGLLLSFWFYLKYRSDEWHSPILFITSLLCYFLGLLGKEMAITLPLLILLYDFTFPPETKENFPLSKRIPVYFGYFLVMFNYLLLRKYAIGSTLGTNFHQTNPLTRILTIPGVWVDYFRLLLFPTNMSADYITLPVTQITDTHAIFPILILLAILFLFTKQRNKNPLIFFFGFWIFITLLPVSDILPIRDPERIEAERFLYIPSVGYCFILSILLQPIINRLLSSHEQRIKDYLIYFLVGLLLLFYATRTIIRNMDWKSNRVFYTKLTEDAPLSFSGWMEMGNIEFRNGNADNAIAYYEQSLACDSTQALIYVNLANSYALKKEYDKASDYLVHAHELAPTDPQIVSNLAFIQFQAKNYGTVILLLQEILSLTPKNNFNYYLLGQAYEQKGMYPEAIYAYQKSLSINSTFSDCWKDLGDTYTKLGKKDLAIQAYSHVK